MIIPAHLNFFSIEACGLYKHGDKEPKGLGISETFDLIYEWVQNKPMEETIPWDPDATRNNVAKCYCHDFYKCEDTGEFLFVLWKSDSTNNGSLLGAQATAQTGTADVVEFSGGHRGKKMLWGRPCYYWIIPHLRTVVSIKLDHSVCDSGLFQEWVSKCITNKVKHEGKKVTATEGGQARFEFKDGNDLTGNRYSYRFDVHLRSVNTASSQLQELAGRVTHIIRRDTIKLDAGFDERPVWAKMFDSIPHLATKPKAKTREIEVRAEAKPTANEIREIISKFSREERKRSEWNNVGFATDKGDVWVDRYRLHETVHFAKETSTVFPASDMHERLAKKREAVLAGVVADEASRKPTRIRKKIA